MIEPLTPEQVEMLRTVRIAQQRNKRVKVPSAHASFRTSIKKRAANPTRGLKARTAVQMHNLFVKRLLQKAGA